MSKHHHSLNHFNLSGAVTGCRSLPSIVIGKTGRGGLTMRSAAIFAARDGCEYLGQRSGD